MIPGLEFALEMFSANYQDLDTKISRLSCLPRHSGCILGHFNVPNCVSAHCDTDSGWPELMIGIFCPNIHEKAILDKNLPICPDWSKIRCSIFCIYYSHIQKGNPEFYQYLIGFCQTGLSVTDLVSASLTGF